MATAFGDKIRIRLKAYDYRVLDQSTAEIVETAKRTGARLAGPIPLPTENNKWTVNRSPHVDKKSREQFEIRTHKRLIDIFEPTSQTVDALMKLDLPAGVDVEIKAFGKDRKWPWSQESSARRSGMTQLFGPDGTVQPVTVIKAGPCVVVQAKTVGQRRLRGGAARPRRGEAGQGDQAAGGPLQEGQRAADARAPRSEAGQGRRRAEGGRPGAGGDVFKGGERVDVIGTSRGLGFQGVMKRHHFAGGAATHGSMFHRAPGSIGASSYPSRVIKGMRAAGPHGRRARDDAEPVRGAGGRRATPADGARRGAGRAGAYVIVRKAVAAKPEPKPQVEKRR